MLSVSSSTRRSPATASSSRILGEVGDELRVEQVGDGEVDGDVPVEALGAHAEAAAVREPGQRVVAGVVRRLLGLGAQPVVGAREDDREEADEPEPDDEHDGGRPEHELLRAAQLVDARERGGAVRGRALRDLCLDAAEDRVDVARVDGDDLRRVVRVGGVEQRVDGPEVPGVEALHGVDRRAIACAARGGRDVERGVEVCRRVRVLHAHAVAGRDPVEALGRLLRVEREPGALVGVGEACRGPRAPRGARGPVRGRHAEDRERAAESWSEVPAGRRGPPARRLRRTRNAPADDASCTDPRRPAYMFREVGR